MTEQDVDTSEQRSDGSEPEEQSPPAEPQASVPESPAEVDEPAVNEGSTAESPPDVEPVTSDEVVDVPAPEADVPASEAPVAEVAAEAGAAVDADTEAVEGEEGAEEEDEEPDYFFTPGDWYVVHTYAGYENKVKANLASRIQSMNMEDKIYEVVVPTEEVMELKSGKMQSVQKKVFPGYILVRMSLDDDSWYVVRNTPGVTGFVGSGAKPTPLDVTEVTKILAPKTDERPKPKLEYETGEVVSVIGGAFAGYSGPVSAMDVDKQRVTVLLDLFGRETPVELTFEQVTKL
jgi:transcription termination/antitermination protein NusG